jgi:hypothetical protein
VALPAAVREEWIRKLGEMELYEPTKGLGVPNGDYASAWIEIADTKQLITASCATVEGGALG